MEALVIGALKASSTGDSVVSSYNPTKEYMATIHESLLILISAHHSIELIIAKIKESEVMRDIELLAILEEEVNVVEAEIVQLNYLLKRSK